MVGDRETEIYGCGSREGTLKVHIIEGEKETAIMGSTEEVELVQGDQIDLYLTRLRYV